MHAPGFSLHLLQAMHPRTGLFPIQTISLSMPFFSNCIETSANAMAVLPCFRGLPLINNTFISQYQYFTPSQRYTISANLITQKYHCVLHLLLFLGVLHLYHLGRAATGYRIIRNILGYDRASCNNGIFTYRNPRTYSHILFYNYLRKSAVHCDISLGTQWGSRPDSAVRSG